MKIVVDTNIICQDYRFVGTGFRLFFDGLKVIHGQLIFPEVVIDEVVNRYREELKSTTEDIIQAVRRIARFVDDRRYKVHLVPDPIEEAKIYKDHLLKYIKISGGIILPYPYIEHKMVVERDLKRMKPFKLDGSGYRDTLIWENIKHILLNDNDSVIFISNNKRDFGEGPLFDQIFHSELPNPEKLIICRSLKDFNDKYILPKLKMLDNLKEALINNDIGKFDLTEWIGSNLLDLIKDYHDIRKIVVEYPSVVNSVHPYAIKNIGNIDIAWVNEMESGDKFVSVAVHIDVEYAIHYDFDNSINYKEKHLKLVKNTSTRTLAIPNYISELLIILSLVIDKNSPTVISASIGPIDGEYGTIDFDGTYHSIEI